MTRRFRLAVILLGALAAVAPTGQVEDTPIAPFYEEATEAELAFYDTELPCPPVAGLENTNRNVTVDDAVTINCDYSEPDQNTRQNFSVRWLKTDYDSYASFLCEDGGERQDDGNVIRDVVKTDPEHAIRAEYTLNGGAPFEGAMVTAIEAMMGAATPYARECAEPPTQLDCPDVPGMVIGSFGPGEADDIQPDTYEQTCSYDGVDPNVDLSLRIEVWWAAQRGVPALYDRLCNEPPMEGVGFGSLIAESVAANATYTIRSPLVGPERSVASAAAQALVDQAIPIARSCEGAEVNPTEFVEFPAYLAPAYTPEFTAGPPPPSGTGGGFDSLPTSTPAAVPSDGGLVQTLIRIGSVVMFALSILGLFITFLLVRRETRIRERRDMLRIGITVSVAVLSVLIIGRDAPLWAVLVAVGLGVAVGTWQGSNLIVRNTERGLVGRRSLIAIVAFGAGVILMQVAGLLNRTGGVALGVAVSFLSAAIAAGLFIGRKPRMTQALGGAARVVLPLLLIGGVLAGLAAAGEAQTEPDTPAPGTCRPDGFGRPDLTDCQGYESLLDVVPWADAFVTGGIWWDQGKPAASISLPRGLTTPPEPVTQAVSWSTTDFSDNPIDYEITETYSFGTLAEGGCCAVFYEGSGTKTTTRNDEVTLETREASGRLEDVQPLGTVFDGDPLGIPFSEVRTLRGFSEDSCQRAVAWFQDDNEPGAATWDSLVVNGESQSSSIDTGAVLFIGCDLPQFTYENALALAPPAPSPDDPARVVGAFADDPGEVCPVRQEFVRSVWNAGRFEGVETLTLGEMFLEPNAPQCDWGSLLGPLSFGMGGRGNTRHEVIYRLAILNDPVAEAVRLADDTSFFYSQSRLTSIPEHERCELGADGVPLQPADGSACRYITIHSLDELGVSSLQQQPTGRTLQTRNMQGGVVHIETDWDTSDGPNVNVRALMPWGKYVYRCHHCTPGSPAVHDFIRGLSGFGRSRATYDPNFPDPEGVETTDTTETEVDPRFTEETEFTPVGEEEGITEEEAALIGLVGLLGSMGLLGASLVGTGLTPGDIASAIRSGDFTGGVDPPPEMLDEDGDPLTVNDGSFPDVPVGHVLWEVDGETRWVPPEEAQDLVNEARAAADALEQDRSDALEAVFGEEGTASQDWKDLKTGTRAEAAEDRMNAAMQREEAQVLIQASDVARDAAAAGNHDDLLDFMEDNPLLTSEQIHKILEAIDRRADDQAALDAIPEVNIWRETAAGSMETMAQLAEAGGRPDIAWILRNPGTSLRVGAAVATGGTSEFVAIPISVTHQLHEAQERSLRENGRMMTSDELFGELGWALGTEAVYEAGGRLAAHGIGRVFSSADELAEAAAREGEEALPRIRSSVEEGLETGAREMDEAGSFRDALSKEGTEGLETGAREGAETGATRHVESGARGGADPLAREGMEAELEAAAREGSEVAETGAREGVESGARELDEGLETGARELDEGMETAGREGAEAVEGGARELDEAGEGLTAVPPKGNEALRDLEPGAPITDDLVEQTGLPRSQLDEIQNYTRENDLAATGRSTNPHSRAPLESGDAVAKPLEVKIKTGSELDVMLGAKPQNRGVVTLFEPRMPNTAGMSDDLIEALERHHAQRMAEWNKYEPVWGKGHRVAEFGGVERTHRLYDGRLQVLYDGKWRSVAGDFDLVDLTRADGSPLSAAEFNRHVEAMVERGLIEHGGEARVMTDILRDSPHPPGSDEWMEQAREVWRLRNNLEDAQLSGAEINVEINGTDGLLRGRVFDEHLPWKGGFEAPDGGGLLGT